MFDRPDVFDLWGTNPAARPTDPARIWRELCWATPQVAVSGDLPYDDASASAQLAGWIAAGVTDILDVRVECNDEHRVARRAPDVGYHWLGVDDEGDRRDPRWFERIVEIGAPILADDSRKLVVHCHMGVNRGPSAAFTLLYATGMPARDALDRIRAARPIASMMYSLDAVEWMAVRDGLDTETAVRTYEDVIEWHRENPLDLGYCIRHIGDRYAA